MKNEINGLEEGGKRRMGEMVGWTIVGFLVEEEESREGSRRESSGDSDDCQWWGPARCPHHSQ